MSYLGEVMEVTPQWCAGPTMILIDSGAFTHTFYGVRRVRARTWCNREIIFEFQVSDVTRPIASVGLLRHRGHPVSFGRWPHIIIAGEPTPLVEAANLFYLPVALPGERLPPMLVEQMQRRRRHCKTTGCCRRPSACLRRSNSSSIAAALRAC